MWMNVCVNEQYLRLLIIHLSVKLKGGATALQPYSNFTLDLEGPWLVIIQIMRLVKRSQRPSEYTLH